MKLVLTGGPSGGKTTLAQTLVREFSDRIVIVPEAASIVYGGGWPRRTTRQGVEHQQKAIYFLQRELEAMLAEESPGKLLLCDRGSLDGLAYWPDRQNPGDFLKAVGSTMEKEIARYDFILHLDTAPSTGYDLTNPLRRESFSEATILNANVREAWKHHPNRTIIESPEDGAFSEKLALALDVVESVLAQIK